MRRYKLCNSLLAVVFASQLTSCFIWKTNVSWITRGFNQVEPIPTISLAKKQRFIPLPLIIVLYNTGSYSVDFTLTSRKDFGKIDSVRFLLRDSTGILHLVKGFKPKARYSHQFANAHERSLNTGLDTLYWGYFDVKLKQFLIDKKRKRLYMNFVAYTTDVAGHSKIFAYDSLEFNRSGPRFGSFL